MDVKIEIKKITTKDITINSMQVWDNPCNERIMTVADGDGMFHVIVIGDKQRLTMPVFSREELVDHLNEFRYWEESVELVSKQYGR